MIQKVNRVLVPHHQRQREPQQEEELKNSPVIQRQSLIPRNMVIQSQMLKINQLKMWLEN